MLRWRKERIEDSRLTDWNDATTSQGMLNAIRNWKSYGTNFPTERLEGGLAG